MDAGHAQGDDPLRHAQRESGGVDRHQKIGFQPGDIGDRLLAATLEMGELGQDLRQAEHRQLGHGKERGQPLPDHLGTADPGEADRVAGSRPQRRHKAATQQVTRRLARDHIDQRTAIAHGFARGSSATRNRPAASAAATVTS